MGVQITNEQACALLHKEYVFLFQISTRKVCAVWRAQNGKLTPLFFKRKTLKKQKLGDGKAQREVVAYSLCNNPLKAFFPLIPHGGAVKN